MRSYLLFAHGARDPEWAKPLLRLRDEVASLQPDADVSVAFLEFMTPDLARALDQAVARGATQVEVVPVFLAQGGHVKRDVPVLLEAARARHPQVSIVLQPALGESSVVIAAVAAAVLDR